jgi:hypothetical protein
MTPVQAKPNEPDDDSLRGRWLWKALPWGMFTRCSVCAEMAYCHGKTRERLLCLECFGADETGARLRRGGKPGPRKGFTYRTRRPQSEMVETVAKLRAEGKVVGAIADELGISDRTVRNYVSKGLGGRKSAPQSL